MNTKKWKIGYWNELTVAMLRNRIKMRELHGQSKAIAHKGKSNPQSRMYPTDEKGKHKEKLN